MRAINWLKVNLLLYGVIACLAAVFWGELAWSWRALAAMAQGGIESPLENRLTWDAEPLMAREPERARAMLERALAIDPYGDARFRLAELALQRRDFAEAEGLLGTSLKVDPTLTEGYLKLAWLLRRTDRDPLARATLEQGIAYFQDFEAYRPRPDPTVGEMYNRKALEVYERYRRSLATLEQTR